MRCGCLSFAVAKPTPGWLLPTFVETTWWWLRIKGPPIGYGWDNECSLNTCDLSSLGVSGHMTWAPMHYFSAAMFFCFQIINNPGRETHARHRDPGVLSWHARRREGTEHTARARPTVRRRAPLKHARGPRAQKAGGSTCRAQTPVSPRRLTLRGFRLAPSRGLALETTPYHRPLSPAHIRTHQDHDHDPDPDLAQPLCPNAQGTTVNVQESERMPILPQAPSAPMLQPQHATCEHPPPKFRWLCEDLDVGDLARYLEQGQQGHPAATQQPQEQQHRNAALPPRQPAETKKRCGDLRRTTHRRRQ